MNTSQYQEVRFGRYKLEYTPGEPYPFSLFIVNGDEFLDCWDDLYQARMDIDYSPVGEEISLEEHKKLWDWVKKFPHRQG